MENLDNLREKIDKIDKKMISLFEERMCAAKQIGEYKIINNLPVLNTKREEIVLENCVNNLEDKNMEKYVKEFMKSVMKISKDYQKDISKDR